MRPHSRKTIAIMVVFAALAALVAGSLPANAATTAAVAEFQGCTIKLSPSIGLVSTGGVYRYSSGTCAASPAGCNIIGATSAPSAGGSTGASNCEVDAPPITIPATADNTYYNIVCGTGWTGNNTLQTDKARMTANENVLLAGSNFSGRVDTKFGLVFAGSIGVVLSSVTADTTGLGLVGQAVNGVVQISADPSSNQHNNCVEGVVSFTATALVAAAKAA